MALFDDDWYRFDIVGSRQVQIAVASDGQNYVLNLFDQNGNLLTATWVRFPWM